MGRRFIILLLMAAAVSPFSGGASIWAVSPDTCQKQRSVFPRKWKSVGGETRVMQCFAKYERLLIRAGRPDKHGRRIISVSLLNGPKPRVFREWVDRATFRKLSRGRSVTLFLRSENSCFIRGNMSGVVYLRVGKGGGRLLVRGEHNLLNSCELSRR